MTGDGGTGSASGSLWLRPERAGRGPVPEYSRVRIAAAAVALADEGGLVTVSMRRVAAVIGTAPASLYRYVANRDELVQLMADQVLGELDLPEHPSGDWLADLLAVARQQLAVYRRHPWLLDLAGTGPDTLSPRVADFLEFALSALAELRIPAATKLEAIAMMSGVVSLFARDELSRGRRHTSAEGQQATAAFLGHIVADGRHPHLAEVLVAGAREPAPGDQTELFERVLTGILGGLLRQV